MPNHDLNDFMQQLQVTLAAEYNRIQRRVLEDPGIAGAQGEENWASLLREWLPATYHVVTRGRVIDHCGLSSPEIDVLVLHPSYPRHLLDKKHYLAAGVVAAFECKLTLRKQHLRKSFETCAIVKGLSPLRSGTPYRELHRLPIYGILAHSHAWKEKLAGGALELLQSLNDNQFEGPQHPNEMLDVVCVASSATYSLFKDILVGIGVTESFAPELLGEWDAKDGIVTSYVCSWQDDELPYMGTALGNLVATIIKRIAYEDAGLRPLASYYELSNMRPAGICQPSLWKPSILSKEVISKMRRMKATPEEWSEWSFNF